VNRLAERLALMLAAAIVMLGIFSPGHAAPLSEDPMPPRPLYDGISPLPRRAPTAQPETPPAAEMLAPDEIPTWSRLVFQSARNNTDWDLYLADGNGSNQSHLFHSSNSHEIHPRLNRGATHVVFASNRSGSDMEIYVLAIGSSTPIQLTDNGADDVYPFWSPDGRKIVFQSYRDGQPEIYTMNADGSGQTRLTNHPAFDGQPAWSPDGSKVAFVSNRDGLYRIWSMNADGSSPRGLSSQDSSANPAWSPDGSKIAYDASEYGPSGWQRLWVMNADGSSQQQIYNPSEFDTDILVRSWSADGRYIAFTRVSWIYYQGAWYWTNAYLDAWDSENPSQTVRLSANGADWYPDWATTDSAPPASTLQPLPAVSPGPVRLNWSATDSGPAGVGSFDFQVRTSLTGPWEVGGTNVAGPSGLYPGRGGTTYYFRVRARDRAGNVEPWPTTHQAVTTVEALPPTTRMSPLPKYVRLPFSVTWQGSDAGGSGVMNYDVQLRTGSGDWQPWVENWAEPTLGNLLLPLGELHRFRVRGRDNAFNEEPWRIDWEGDAQTTPYWWAMRGRATDNRGVPLSDQSVALSKQPFADIPSDIAGSFAAYVAELYDWYTATASRIGYGSVPSTTFTQRVDAAWDIVLPPADNTVQGGDFEEPALAAAWQASGAITPLATNIARRSGNQAGLLGCEPFTSLDYFTVPRPAESPQMMVDAMGVAHLVWINYQPGGPYGDIFYTRRSPNGVWASPFNVSNSAENGSFGAKLAVGPNGIVHLVWMEYGPYGPEVVYAQRTSNGMWSAHHQIARGTRADMAVDGNGSVHVAWSVSGVNYDSNLYYAQRSAGGIWSATEAVVHTTSSEAWPHLAVSPQGLAHVFWWSVDANGYRLHYASRSVSGSWSPSEQVLDRSVTSGGGEPGLVGPELDRQGNVHVLFWDRYITVPSSGMIHASRDAAGRWQLSTLAAARHPGEILVTADMVVQPDGRVHALWVQGDTLTTLLYRSTTSSGGWSSVETLASDNSNLISSFTEIQLAVGPDSRPLAAWRSGIYFGEIMTMLRQADGTWTEPFDSSRSGGNMGLADYPQLAVDGQGIAHLAYILLADPWGNDSDIVYSNSAAPVSGVSRLAQTVSVPATNPAQTLSLFSQLHGAAESSAGRLEVKVNNTTLLSSTERHANWTHRWFDLSPWAGQQVSISFDLSQTAGQPCTWGYLDEVTLGSSYPDLWLSAPGQSARPGEPLAFALRYGNRGGAPAANVTVSATLPSELTFVNANPSPVATAPALRWNLGNLAADSGPFSIVITTTQTTPLAAGTLLISPATIETTTAELERTNNASESRLWIGRSWYLPIMLARGTWP